ncbi:MAG: riboflavin synthase [Pseudomonadota bacterium]
MFTGIIQTIGEITAQSDSGGDRRLTVATPGFSLAGFDEGESIAVSGVCLTALDIADEQFSADVSIETLSATTLGALGVGDRVNIEPSLALGDRLGGHLVSGHVDGVGEIRRIRPAARSTALTIAVDGELSRYIARKGSVTIDGISLTVNAVDNDTFELNIIPHTWDVTTLGNARVGRKVNVEVDLIARYVERLQSGTHAPAHDGAFLAEHGYER